MGAKQPSASFFAITVLHLVLSSSANAMVLHRRQEIPEVASEGGLSGQKMCTDMEDPACKGFIGGMVVIAFLVILIGFWCFCRRRKKRQARAAENSAASNSAAAGRDLNSTQDQAKEEDKEAKGNGGVVNITMGS